MQFIAECGIEYGLQFVTQFFLNPPDCLYTKKFCDFLQSYEKTREEQKKNAFLFCSSECLDSKLVSLGSSKNLGFALGTHTRKNSNKYGFSLAYWINFSRSEKKTSSIFAHLLKIFVPLHPILHYIEEKGTVSATAWHGLEYEKMVCNYIVDAAGDCRHQHGSSVLGYCRRTDRIYAAH
jgi:hypothetical protein